jgi:methylenetetrahydrofolate dehydrogenase (NADP+) / methenyltetrahydrofolate cyclohydrolase
LPADVRAVPIDGVRIARAVRDDVAREVAALTARGVTPGLAVVLVGDDPASQVYVRSKEKASAEAGMLGRVITLPAETSMDRLLGVVDGLNADATIHGILVQMPLPPHLDSAQVIRRVDPAKDVDGLHPLNLGRLLAGDSRGFAPCTPLGVMELLARSAVNPRGLDAVVVGRSILVGKPMAALLLQANATVTVCHSHSVDLAAHLRRADLVVAAIGRPAAIHGDMLKRGAVVIDVGINRIADPAGSRGRLVGDVDYASAESVASLITPVPGGVGPMTIAMLLRNTVLAARRTIPGELRDA